MYSILNTCKSHSKKLRANWLYYKAANQGKSLLLFNYLFWVLFYRRIVCYVIALPLVIIYFLLYPFIKFRFVKLIGSALGHYAVTTELLLSEMDALKNDKFKTLFYLEHSLYEQSICNEQLHAMWKRIIFILPLQVSGIAHALDKFLMILLKNTAYGMNGIKSRYENRWVRDPKSLLMNTPSHLTFTADEHRYAQEQLQKINIQQHDKYICLFVRSSAYNSHHPTWNYPERNVDIKTYMKAAHFLAEKGYYVLRMGKVVDDTIDSSHPRIIDYARSEIRSDFMDIYLSACCYFFITTGSGLDGIPQIFKRPILYTNCFILPHIASWYPHTLFTIKHLQSKKSGEFLPFADKINFFQSAEFISRSGFHVSDYIQKHDLEFVDNTEDELVSVVKEMEAIMTNTWIDTPEHQQLQEKFWQIFSTNIRLDDHHDKDRRLHGELYIKIGSSFLHKYQHLLS